jgi:hypothetical protein
MSARPFSKPVIQALETAKIVGIRAGLEPHRFLGVWVVVVDGRVFIRSWNDKPNGWRQAFRDDARGALQIPSGRELPIKARPARGERLMTAIEEAYAAKYPTPGSRKYVVGFRRPRRRATTIELVPR